MSPFHHTSSDTITCCYYWHRMCFNLAHGQWRDVRHTSVATCEYPVQSLCIACGQPVSNLWIPVASCLLRAGVGEGYLPIVYLSPTYTRAHVTRTAKLVPQTWHKTCWGLARAFDSSEGRPERGDKNASTLQKRHTKTPQLDVSKTTQV